MAFCASISLKQAPENVGRTDATINKNTILSYAEAIKEVKKSVVNISTSKTIARAATPFDDFFNDPYFRHFFDFDGHGQRGMGGR